MIGRLFILLTMTRKDRTDPQKAWQPPAEAIIPTVRPPQPQQLTLEQAMRAAEELQQAGRLPEAEQVLRNILQSRPDFAPAVHLLGVLAHSVGKTDVAVDLVGHAIALDGKQSLYYANMGEMCRILERFDDAVKYGKKAVELEPGSVAAQSNLGLAYFDLKDYDKAAYCHGKALKLDPAFAPSINNMGSIARARHDDEKAEEYFRAAIAANPRFRDARNNLGEILVRRDRPQEALEVLDSLIADHPDYVSAHSNRGLALRALNRVTEAEIAYRLALRADPEFAPAYAGMIMIALEVNNTDAGAELAKRLLELKPEEADSHSMSGTVLLAEGRDEEAERAFKRALELDEKHVPARLGLGRALMERGDLPEAEKLFRACLDADEESRLAAVCSLVHIKKVKPDAPEIAIMEEEAKKLDGPLIDFKVLQLTFALGKMHDDLKQYDRAFPYFIEGCRVKRKSFDYSVNDRTKEIARTKAVFTKDFMKSHAGAGYDSDVPIFVLGMPRSGTTLTEQILSSHPDVYGAGELRDLSAQIDALPQAADFAAKMEAIDDAALTEMGRKYVEGLKARANGEARVTDKMPANFHYIGLIKLMLPNAKIVHVMRNPADTCVSCFTRNFANGQNFSYDLAELGHYYRTYRELMAHWREILPAGSFYDLSYEKLVDDTETEAKKLLAYCNLPWDDVCLDFHKTKRNIRTTSVTQVRQPIYKSSKERWRNYERHLAPLLNALGDEMDA